MDRHDDIIDDDPVDRLARMPAKVAIRTCEEVGMILGVTRARVQQIEAGALLKLYSGMRRDPVIRRMAAGMGIGE